MATKKKLNTYQVVYLIPGNRTHQVLEQKAATVVDAERIARKRLGKAKTILKVRRAW